MHTPEALIAQFVWIAIVLLLALLHAWFDRDYTMNPVFGGIAVCGYPVVALVATHDLRYWHQIALCLVVVIIALLRDRYLFRHSPA